MSFSCRIRQYFGLCHTCAVPSANNFAGCHFLWIVFVVFFFVLCTLCCQFLWIVLCFCFVFPRKIVSPSTYCLILGILLNGDIHINPGPIKYPCTLCQKSVRSNQKAIQCDFCDNWTHLCEHVLCMRTV